MIGNRLSPGECVLRIESSGVTCSSIYMFETAIFMMPPICSRRLLAPACFVALLWLQSPLLGDDVPHSVAELWAGFDDLDRSTPLAAEVLKEWEQDGVICRVVRYQVGVFKGAPARVAAFYAFPKGGERLPALLSLHGGGQSANFDDVLTDARRGYASIALNWGGNKLNFGRSNQTYDGPQTDWGRLDATHPPQRNKTNHFAGPLSPDDYTLDDVESPRNSNWFLVLMAARRALTFLQSRPEVDAERLGAYGHSMGGKLTTDLAGIDRRVRAAVPSCGGAGDVLTSQTELPGCVKTKPSALELACISDNAYLSRITCPMLWLSPTNDFNAPIGNMAWNWRRLPDATTRFSIAPHLNHRHTDEHLVTRLLWFEQHLKQAFTMPSTPRLELNLKAADGVPRVTVVPDDSLAVKQVDIYYSIDPHELSRFWRDAGSTRLGSQWTASCPILSAEQPLFAFANVTYELPLRYRTTALGSGEGRTDMFTISSRVAAIDPASLQQAGLKATDAPQRMIDDGSRSWRDWYRLNWSHPPLWTASTRKLKDAKWRGPNGATLRFEIKSATDNTLVVKVNTNAWGAFVPGKFAVDYAVAKQLKGSPEWQSIVIRLNELTATDRNLTTLLADWQTVTELSLSPSGEVVEAGVKRKIDGKPWVGPREIRNLHWEGGEYPHRSRTDSALNPDDLRNNFHDAIEKSLEQEKADRKK